MHGPSCPRVSLMRLYLENVPILLTDFLYFKIP